MAIVGVGHLSSMANGISCMKTKLLYLDEFEVVTADATVASTRLQADGRSDVILDQTCFYPRGGGQDWDTGTISGDDDAIIFRVDEVRLDEDGVVHHLGAFDNDSVFVAGNAVRCAVDAARRDTNTRLHSAGHVVDLAVDKAGLGWGPVRGAHYPHMSFVEYDGAVPPEGSEHIKHRLQAIVDEALRAGGANEIRFMPVADTPSVCHHVPPNIPTNKPARVVIYNGNYGVPCGGTHVAEVKDIGKVTITKVKTKQGLTKVSYSVEGIN